MNLNMQASFGGIERVQKQSDVLIGSFSPSSPTPESFMPDFTGTIEMQYQTPSCGAHSGQSVKQVLETFRGSPEYLWKAMRLVDKLSPDVGANMATIMERLANRGICSFSILPNNANISNSDYASPATITPEMDADALNHKIGVYGFTFNPTFQQIKDAIYQHKAVILLLRVGAEWWTAENGQGSWAETDILPLKPNSQPITSRHFVTAYAFDKDYIFFINSWSDTWGRKGIGYFGSDYAYRCVEIGTTINLSAKYIFTKVLRFGMKSYDVKQLQLKLGISADGIFGNQTLTTVKTFQTTHNLMADGIVGAKTNAILNSL